MPNLELEGKIKAVLPQQSGESARGAWVRQDFVIEYQDGNFPAEACFSAWGQDRVNELNSFGLGANVKVQFNVRAREYQGRWYNDLRPWRISAATGQPAPAPVVAAAAAATPAAPAAAQAVTPQPAPAGPVAMELDNDDLPF